MYEGPANETYDNMRDNFEPFYSLTSKYITVDIEGD